MGASCPGHAADGVAAGGDRRRRDGRGAALWPLEVANALTVLRRRRKLTEDERQAGLGWLRRLPLRLDHEMALLAFSRLSELASAHELSVYDAAYLELAQRKGLALACQDGPLRKASPGRRRPVGVSRRGAWSLRTGPAPGPDVCESFF